MTGKHSLYFGVSDGFTYKVDATIFSDDGNPITVRIRAKYDTCDGKRSTIKTFQNIVLFGDFPQGMKLLTSLRNRDGLTDYEMLKMIKDDTEGFTLMEKGTALSLGFDETSNKKFEWEGYDIEYNVEQERI